MDIQCGVVGDLLPAYADGVCGPESKRVVEEHLAGCALCRARAEELRKAGDRRASKHVSQEAVLRALGVLGILLYWAVFFWQDRLSAIGDYRYFPYAFHELWSTVMAAVLPATLIWLAALLYRTVKGRAWRKNAALLVVLAVLATGQIGFFLRQADTVRTTAFCARVVEIVDDYHIVIKDSGRRLVLETDPVVTALLRTDGTEYSLQYAWVRRDPDRGRLITVLDTEKD